jgi:hypothetical protein
MPDDVLAPLPLSDELPAPSEVLDAEVTSPVLEPAADESAAPVLLEATAALDCPPLDPPPGVADEAVLLPQAAGANDSAKRMPVPARRHRDATFKLRRPRISRSFITEGTLNASNDPVKVWLDTPRAAAGPP